MKRIILAAAILGAVSLSSVGASTSGKWGDTNCSGTINSADIVNVKLASVGLPMNIPETCVDGFLPAPADVNCSGVVNAADIVLIKQLAVGDFRGAAAGCPGIGWEF
jgi:hypothetical protein